MKKKKNYVTLLSFWNPQQKWYFWEDGQKRKRALLVRINKETKLGEIQHVNK